MSCTLRTHSTERGQCWRKHLLTYWEQGGTWPVCLDVKVAGGTAIREDREYRTACAVCRVTLLHVLCLSKDVSAPILQGHILRPKSLPAKTAHPNP